MGTDRNTHRLNGADEFVRAVHDADARTLFAGSGVEQFTWTDEQADGHVGGAILRRDDPDRRVIGVYDLAWAGAGRFGLGVVLADPEDWGRGLGMDAMTAVMRHVFYHEGARTFAMAAGVHNFNTALILASGKIRPEALCAASIVDRGRLTLLALGAMNRTEFEEAGYGPPPLSDRLWRDARAAAGSR
ncbi:GNAT family N-acetyltransferase [Tsukamurella sp. 1534]|uniref:GNAT family N-acetyltransferase n=1 Tax=Tsukamurella sp. 1534 TaxID=1151061 RepID=UPI0003173002|nr:GNAT family protein [Tsukamurella sp. 1534]